MASSVEPPVGIAAATHQARGAEAGRRLAASVAAWVTVLGACLLTGRTMAWRSAPPPDREGACYPFGATCRDAGCHITYPLGSTTLVADLHLDAPAPGPLPPAYVPGHTFALRLDVTDTDAGAAVWGFELAPLLAAACPTPAAGGTVVPGDPGRATAVTAGGINYLEHACTCVNDDAACCGFVPEVTPGVIGWSFQWTAPARGAGTVTFYEALLAANWDGTPSFDRVALAHQSIDEESCPPAITDLRVAVEACDPTAPGEPRVHLAWTPAGSGAQVVRTTGDRALLPGPRDAWARAPSDCLPIDPPALVFYSVAGTCALGSEGPH